MVENIDIQRIREALYGGYGYTEAEIRNRIVPLLDELIAWRQWADGLTADFAGVTDNPMDPDRIHAWEDLAERYDRAPPIER